MCRLFGFRSSMVSGVHSSLVAAENALMRQSTEHPDGWGVAYYHHQFPHLMRSEKQALGDGLFGRVSGVVTTRTLVAHIRQATTGSLDVLNCHPFQHGPWVFAHNGQVAGYALGSDVAEKVKAQIDPRFRGYVFGQTDSEVCFYLFLSRLARRVEDIYHAGIRREVVVDALKETVDVILDAAPCTGCPDQNGNRLNFMVTNGGVMVATKFRRPLHFTTHKTRCPERDTCAFFEPNRCEQEVADGLIKHIMISSEPVGEQGKPNVWREMQDGDFVAVDTGMNFIRGQIAALSDNPLPIVS